MGNQERWAQRQHLQTAEKHRCIDLSFLSSLATMEVIYLVMSLSPAMEGRMWQSSSHSGWCALYPQSCVAQLWLSGNTYDMFGDST